MTDTNISMVAKTVGLGASPPSRTAGSTGDTVLNETAFDVSAEIRETVNPVGPEAGQARARIGGMTCDELVRLLESNGAEVCLHRLHLPAPDIMLAEVQMVQPPCTSLHRPCTSLHRSYTPCTAPAPRQA